MARKRNERNEKKSLSDLGQIINGIKDGSPGQGGDLSQAKSQVVAIMQGLESPQQSLLANEIQRDYG